MHNLLVVEDDDTMAVALCEGFRQEGYAVERASDGELALQLAEQKPPCLIVLDVMLPKLSGHDVCKRLRSAGSDVPIIMLTARGQEIDKVLGLKMGADDYITKPFSFMELLARVEAVLRRTTCPELSTDLHAIGDVRVDLGAGTAFKGDAPLELSRRELQMLEYFLAHRGQVVARDALLDAVWGYDEAPLTRTVDVHVSKLRKKLEGDPQHPKHLITVHGIGYKLTT